MNRRLFFTVCGYVLLLFWILSSITHFYLTSPTALFWFCNLYVVLLAVACFEQSRTFIYFLTAQGILFQSPWVLDWISFALTGHSLFNLSSFYEGFPLYFMVLTFIRHTLTVPLSFVLLAFFTPEAPSKKAIGYWMIATVFVLCFSYFLSLSVLYPDSINCAYSFCAPGLVPLSGLPYFVLWTSFVLLASLFSLFCIVRPLHRLIYSIISSH